MIRRSGARCIPEALRLAPGVDVARVNVARWAISIRGFNGIYARKLLVQIDGRTIYSPTFGGVYWDIQNVVLEDVERIEVVRGPGGTMWGANAVNGVINILTKSAEDTQGGYYEGGAGSKELGFNTVRYGGRLGDDGHYRVYGMWYERDGMDVPEQPSLAGSARMAQTGFRSDWKTSCCDGMTLQGDYYNGYSDSSWVSPGSFPPDFADTALHSEHVLGANILYRWTHTLNDESDWVFQCYYDNVQRHVRDTIYKDGYDIFDLDFQHRFPLGDRHDVIWGCGYRNTKMTSRSNPFHLSFDPPERTDNLFSYFLQDQITLREDLLYLIMGSKFEHNDYTGFEFQPSVRMLWTPSSRHSIWGAISRAVQVPVWGNDNSIIINPPAMILPPDPTTDPPTPEMPVFPVLIGDTSIQSEDVLAYELGIRVQPTDAFYWDLAVFFNKYEKLIAAQPGIPYGGLTPGGWPAVFAPMYGTNWSDGETYGFELAAGYTLNEQWKIRGTYSFLCMSLHDDPGLVPLALAGENPRNQFNLWLSGDLRDHWHLDLIGRYVDNLSALAVPNYFVGDVRLAWRPQENFEVFLVGRNLLDQSHYEWGSGEAISGTVISEIQQEVYGGVAWRF